MNKYLFISYYRIFRTYQLYFDFVFKQINIGCIQIIQIVYSTLFHTENIFLCRESVQYMQRMNDSLNELIMYQEIHLQKKNTVQIQKIKQAIAFAQTRIKLGQVGNHVVIFWGYTGTGKSTSIIILNGQDMYAYNQYGNSILTNTLSQQDRQKRIQKEKKGQVVIFIEQGINSGTVYPACLPMKTDGRKEKIVMWDTPGFGDTKGITQILINTYFIHRLFNLQHEVKLVFTINYNDLLLDLKGSKFIVVIKTLSEALKKFNDYEKSMALLVTKATSQTTTQDIQKLLQENLKQNMALGYEESNPQIKKFFQIIKNNQIPIILIKKPVTKKNVHTQKNPLYVTQQFIDFKQEFYQTVTKKLKPAKIPKLEAPGMQPQQIQKIIDFAKQVNLSFSNQQKFINDQLISYVHNQHKNIKFSDDNQANKKYMKIISKVKSFIQKISNIVNKICQGKVQLLQNFQSLAKLFQQQQILFLCKFKNGKQTCFPMQKLRNLLIIVDFLSSINFRTEEVNYQNTLTNFFAKIKLHLQNISQVQQKQQLEVKKQFQKFISVKILQHLQKWKKQQIFAQWQENIKTVPSLYLKMNKYNSQTDLRQYFEEMEKLEEEADMQCRRQIKPLYEIVEHSIKNNIFTLAVCERQIIQNQIKPKLRTDLNNQNSAWDYQKWTQDQIKKIDYKKIAKSNQKQLRQLQQIYLNKLINQSDNKSKIQQLTNKKDQQIKNLKDRINNQQKEKQEKSKHISELETKVNNLNSQKKQKDGLIASLKDKVSSLKNQIFQLNGRNGRMIKFFCCWIIFE